MRNLWILCLSGLMLSAWPGFPVHAQSGASASLHIEWEVKNRFRLFRNEADFQRHVAAARNDGILGAEGRLERESDGRGWARDTVERLCADRAGKLLEFCDRDGAREIYLSPRDHRVGVILAGPVPQNLGCVWSFEDGEGEPRQATVPCDEEVKLRVVYGKTTVASVDVLLTDGTAQRVVTDVTVRDVLIAGLGDSVAAGEGNPDRAILLSDEGFCFKRFLSSGASEYYRPGRAGFSGNKSCVVESGNRTSDEDWARQSARWQSGACHRSLYGYQMRTALGLAVESIHLAVTFIPLGCSGSTIDLGLFNPLMIRECPRPGTTTACPSTTRPQIKELTELLAQARRHRADRKLDLVLLTVGANDILFAGLIADVMVDATTDRVIFGRGGAMASVADARKILDSKLPGEFTKLRAALKPLVGGDLSRVVYVTYGHPALAGPNTPCPGGRDGFDVHPSFAIDAGRMHRVADFVANQFLPKIRALALCDGARICANPNTDRMTFVDSHQAAFAHHGFCARSNSDPEFDRSCFSTKGDSFRDNPAEAATDPFTCGQAASEYRPYAPRARWVRTANDSYLTAMTYPQGLPIAMQPSDLHDATWGTLSAVYGGAIHPTAEGHAAMADAALPAVRAVLGLGDSPSSVRSEALPPPVTINTAPR